MTAFSANKRPVFSIDEFLASIPVEKKRRKGTVERAKALYSFIEKRIGTKMNLVAKAHDNTTMIREYRLAGIRWSGKCINPVFFVKENGVLLVVPPNSYSLRTWIIRGHNGTMRTLRQILGPGAQSLRRPINWLTAFHWEEMPEDELVKWHHRVASMDDTTRTKDFVVKTEEVSDTESDEDSDEYDSSSQEDGRTKRKRSEKRVMSHKRRRYDEPVKQEQDEERNGDSELERLCHAMGEYERRRQEQQDAARQAEQAWADLRKLQQSLGMPVHT